MTSVKLACGTLPHENIQVLSVQRRRRRLVAGYDAFAAAIPPFCYTTASEAELSSPEGSGGTMAKLQSELQPVQFKPARWQAVLGPAIAGVGLLLLIGLALSV